MAIIYSTSTTTSCFGHTHTQFRGDPTHRWKLGDYLLYYDNNCNVMKKKLFIYFKTFIQYCFNFDSYYLRFGAKQYQFLTNSILAFVWYNSKTIDRRIIKFPPDVNKSILYT